jgi:SAM-dependent methyltransferase
MADRVRKQCRGLPAQPARLARRLYIAIGRRLRHAWNRLTGRDRRGPVEAAVNWLLRAGAGPGVCEAIGDATLSPQLTAACIETASAYGLREEADRWARWLASIEPVVGPDPDESLKSDSIETAAVARQAVAWYRSGRRAEADRAMRRLERVQFRDGGFPARAGWFVPRFARRADAWTAKHYLDAALLRVRAAFEARWQDFPESIDAEDGRVQAVKQWFSTLPPGASVADVGCGRGRFLRHLAVWFPQSRLTGIDLSPAMLARLPPGVNTVEGSILRIPLPDAALDGALAVESLEHALLPERAMAELCRVVRPGGRVLVIDKDRRKQPLSEYDPWERWFAPEELAAWMERWCEDVVVRHVPHAEGRPGSDLFLAASGVRRAAPR